MLIDKGDFHASAFILGPDDTTVLIRDMRKDTPLWKFPGGKKQLLQPLGKKRRGERPIETLLREVREETGLWLPKGRTEYVATFDEGNHNKHVFLSRMKSFRRLKPLSKEYEEAKVFSIADLPWLHDFHSKYLSYYHTYIVPRINI